MTAEEHIDRALQGWIADAVWSGTGEATASAMKENLAAEFRLAVNDALERAALQIGDIARAEALKMRGCPEMEVLICRHAVNMLQMGERCIRALKEPTPDVRP